MHKVWVLFIGMSSGCLHASSQTPIQQTVFETFWQPLFHGEQLSYCDEAQSRCGRTIAQQYCCDMGYEGVKQFEKAANLGLTNYISGKNACQGWQCDGFQWITCYGHRTYRSRPLSDYRQKLFTLPHWRKFPLAWCADGHQGCGAKVAHRFCRWQGFSKVQSYSAPKMVIASRSMINNALCIQQECKSFEYIICAR